MKRNITTMALVAAMLLAAAPTAFATHPEAPPVSENRPGNDECRPGSDNQHNGPWTLMDKEAYVQRILVVFPGAPEDLVNLAADATWDFCDHNDDGFACVKEQTLPNDASGSGTYWITLDNHPFGGKG